MSNRATPKLKQIARRLLAHELESRKSADTKNSPTFHVCEKMREPLGKLLGAGGFRALMMRALALASEEVLWLRGLEIKADGSLDGLKKLDAKHYPRANAEGETVLVAQLLGLLVTFIGSALTQRLLCEIWPKMDNLNF